MALATRATAAVAAWRQRRRSRSPNPHLRPAWAERYGQDTFGNYAVFALPGVEQRMRWIPPCTFLMGSPEEEAGRVDDELQHQVTLTEGFWLANTPCTQALWHAVMGESPSRFESSSRPVERVSWEETQAFCAALGERLPDLSPRLPTEAEWECACRAGTETATYAGDLEIHGAKNAPVLDEIAWYGGNSGVGFELEEGEDSSGWPEKQYPHRLAGTREVALKTPNRWGLYDMLGNVWEWCEDWYGEYQAGPSVDPVGPEEGSHRVIRGGSWFSNARLVRAAYRLHWRPSHRHDALGFRLARGQSALR